MKTKSRIFLSFIAVGSLSLACSLLTGPTAPPSATQTPAYVIEPSVPPEIEPLPQPPVTTNLPDGLATVTEQTLSFYDLNGALVSQVELPQFTFPQRNRLHVAGPMPASGGAVPLLYLSFGTEESLHYRDGDGQIFAVLKGTSFLALAGVPGQPVVAFSEIEYLDTALRSKLYVGSVQSLSSAAPVSVIDDPESWAVKPILVEADDGTPTKIWYTRAAYGIGGDIVFEPRKGLFVLDLVTGQERTVLDSNVSPWGISADRNRVAYTSNDLPPNLMCVKDLRSGAEMCFPELPASEPRGAGNGFFSPDAQHVAWMEGDGWQMAETPNFRTTVRVGQIDGAAVADLPMDAFEGAAGIGPLSWAEPVDWLDNQTLLVQVRGQEWSQTVLLTYNIISQEIGYLAPGEFVGLMYP